jgi:hypothetical protein
MTKFPYQVTELAGGLYKLSFIDFPALNLFSKSHYVLRLEAGWALNALVAIRIRKGLSIPKPADVLDALPIEEHIDFRLRLYWGMQNSGLSREGFARELVLSSQTVDNILDGDDDGTSSPYIEAIASQKLTGECNGASISTLSQTPANRTAQLALLAV